jgi:predicted Rossmann fold nucleotide-binding protein DprA/Smf involved in DNA uptake
MKVIIAGSRDIPEKVSRELIELTIKDSELDVTEVVSGGARGVDTHGENWAFDNNIPVRKYLADWDKYGRGAGMIRNRMMAAYADALIAIWDGQSRGTENMIKTAKQLGLMVYVMAPK